MSETELWRRMAEHLPPGRLEIWAESIVLGDLGGRTVQEAIADGLPFTTIWRAVWAMLDLPASYR
ncbi:DUF3046 domain-containing protein [Luteococcus sp. H138]|uniref:DUF3046 domain-containing protein n=1 Tax=unclassified Luteococcus TaxID=2639923 RepID=UPI00313DA352